MGSIPGLGWTPAEGNGNPLQHFLLGNPMDRGGYGVLSQGVRQDLASKKKQQQMTNGGIDM